MDLLESKVTVLIQRDDRAKWLSYSNHNIKCFTEDEIRRITSNYETIIGKGGFGEVYKGVLQDGIMVAVKRFIQNVEENFAKELKVHCEINHKNVVRLIGYCAEKNALMIVSEYISRGNLSDVLHHECIPITLDTRLRIAVECSEALCYMHSQMYTKVIHGDIKPANILLDDNFNAKISDFGISRLVNMDGTLFTEHVIGSIGYMDPLFARSGHLTSKSDVYSFGIVLVELITKKKATTRNVMTGIVDCFTQALETGERSVRELFDVEISSQNNMKVLEGLAELAGQCLMMKMDSRPDMIDVAERLRALRKTRVQEKQTLSNHNMKCFTEDEIRRITSNYKTIIGKGGFGEVYKGVLLDGSIVAVKRFICNVEENFAKELKVHCEINHKNVVRLIGYCARENALMIVSEYMSEGNLSDVLHHEFIPITLDTRLRIAVECSEALCHMHSQMYTQVIHGDIKPANILLDDNFIAKISDFGISRLVNTDAAIFTEHVIGSIAYMDPLFARSRCLTSKSDVYSFGIILVELITKKKATIRNGETGIVECFTQALATGKRRVRELFDVEISSQNNMKVLEGIAKLAGQCVKMEMHGRPEMRDVAERLRALRKTQVQGKQMLTIFPWGWRNKTTAQNNCQSSGSIIPHASGIHVARSFPSKPRHFSHWEIICATRFFDELHLVGVGGSSKVYYGMINGGATKVAIKHGRVEQDANKFQIKIAMMAKLCHHHLVSLVGYCTEENEMILVYEYMARGTLHGNLYANNTDERPLTWRQRLDICIGAAHALRYLHERSIIHNDVSTTNILLDETLVGKVSSIVSLPQNVTHEICQGCFDPEFFSTGELTEKSNVYSFGVVMFEVLCARAAYDPNLPRRQAHLVKCALSCQKKAILDLIVDPYLEGKIAPRCFKKFVEIAVKCVGDCGIDRPTMQEVLQNLEMCLEEQSRSLGDEMPGDADIDGPSRRDKCQLNLEVSLAEDDDSSHCSEISTFEDDGMDGDEQVADGMDSKLPIDSSLCRHFSLTEMKSVTRNFDESHLVCVGGSHEVYYGMIDGGATKVAIKRGRVEQDVSKFQTEIAMTAKLRHHHLVSLIGYCKEENELILIYDYMARGTLRGNLYANKTKEPPLTWRQRLDICIGAARALHYLHERSIVHNDVSTASILLDWRLVGKVSSKISPWQDVMHVSRGCEDPELTEKSNVCSFGVVLFEILCARADRDPNLPRRQANLVECFFDCKKKGVLFLIVDPYLQGKISPRCFNKFVEIAGKCVRNRSIHRPTMQEVLENLELCLAEQSGSLGD